jgi:hypothetical protein
VPSAEERFRAKVKHRGGHDIWTGSRDHRGVGMVRIDGKLRTAQRAAWEFAHGPVEAGARVNTCAVDRACVAVSHLSLSPAAATEPTTVRRRRRGTGSVRELRPGAWEIAFTIDPPIDGRAPRRHMTVEGDRDDAVAELERIRSLLARDDLGDLRIRELVGRYLDDLHRGPAATGDHDLLHDILEPALGSEIAALATTGHIHQALDNQAKHGAPLPDVRDALRLVRASYRWAIARRLHDEDPTADIDTRWLGR